MKVMKDSLKLRFASVQNVARPSNGRPTSKTSEANGEIG